MITARCSVQGMVIDRADHATFVGDPTRPKASEPMFEWFWLTGPTNGSCCVDWFSLFMRWTICRSLKDDWVMVAMYLCKKMAARERESWPRFFGQI